MIVDDIGGAVGALVRVAASLLGWGLVGLSMLESIEIADLLLHRPAPPHRPPDRHGEPFVSLHVPICSEPSDVVLRTLSALRDMDYGAYDVLVVDNNTADERLWRPVEAFCRQCGPRFAFHHLPHCPGFKAGALNHALAQTAPAATLVGVIDADYEVESRYLKDLVGFFDDGRIGFVQTPQDYRAWDHSLFSRLCYWEYRQFFAVSMMLRDRRNAILMHGTMALIRKDLLIQAGRWGEWCLTEDSELGLRMLSGGCHGLYVPETYGRGLTPYSIGAFKRQRRRWVEGGAQQLRRHIGLFVPRRRRADRLTGWQALHYLQGWLPWLRDGIVVLSLPIGAILALAVLTDRAPPASAAPLALGLLGVLAHLCSRQWVVCRHHLGLSWRDTAGCAALLAGLTWSIGTAWFLGWFDRRRVFRRTPKSIQAEPHWTAAVPGELLLGGATLPLALFTAIRCGRSGFWLIALLLAQALLLLPAGWLAFTAAAVRNPAVPDEAAAAANGDGAA